MIDAVITWVDGDDPEHVAKRERHDSRSVHPSSRAATRFASRGEIGYCVASILSFCSFVDRVFIVTDAQWPSALDPLLERRPDWTERIRIVDHQEMFGVNADLLPVFSSRSIETMLFRIPDLAECFIYFNDDMFVGRPLSEDLFFQDGRPVLQGRMHRFPNPILGHLKAWLKPEIERAGFKHAQQRAARMVGFKDKYFLAGHHPHPMRCSTLERFFDAHPGLLRRQAGHRFRSAEQFSPIGIAYHLEVLQGATLQAPGPSGYLKPTAKTDRHKAVLQALALGQLDTICIQSLDAMPRTDQDAILRTLDDWLDAVMIA